MDDRTKRLEEAFQMLCDWTGYHPAKRNTVVTIALDDILNGRDTDMVERGRDLVRQKIEADARKPGRRIAP